eukprot:gene18361-24057_t
MNGQNVAIQLTSVIQSISINIGFPIVIVGLDNHQLISNNTGYVITTETPKINTSVDIISQNGKSFETINSTPTLVEIESEKDWLLSLQGFVNLTAAVDTTTNNTNIHKVTSSNGVSNDSNGEASNGLSIDVTEANNPNSKIPLSKTPVSAVASTRRQSTDKLKSNVTQDKKEVGDFFRNLLVQAYHNIQCRDPDAGGTSARNKDRKFLIFGADGSEGAGLGNLLIFFPSAYYFAAFTGRDIAISDGSTIGALCQVIHCGFPFLSDLSKAFPDILSPENLVFGLDLKGVDFNSFMDNRRIDIENNPIIRANGYKPFSEWWSWYNHTVKCVSKLTGCDLDDIACADRHAFQRLIRGPFRSQLTDNEEKRIHGVPDHIKHAILTLPHAYAPRLDAAIHLRNQFEHFEHSSNISDPEYVKEVTEWLNSTEASNVFGALENKLLEHVCLTRNITVEMLNNLASLSIDEQRRVNQSMQDTIYVYLATDNEQVKDYFIEILERNHSYHFPINIMRVDTNFIHHVKNLQKMKSATGDEGLLDLVFDWYALSLSNVIFAWRKGYTNMVSTFAHSAQRVSGTIERSDLNKPPGRGVGTIGYQLVHDRWGNQRFDKWWVYSFLEDYANPPPENRKLRLRS